MYRGGSVRLRMRFGVCMVVYRGYSFAGQCTGVSRAKDGKSSVECTVIGRAEDRGQQCSVHRSEV